MSETEIVWEAPPEKRRPATRYGPLLDQVKARPGHWGRVGSGLSQSGAYSAKKSLLKQLKDERWKIAAGRIEEGGEEYGVWALYRTPEQLRADNGK